MEEFLTNLGLIDYFLSAANLPYVVGFQTLAETLCRGGWKSHCKLIWRIFTTWSRNLCSNVKSPYFLIFSRHVSLIKAVWQELTHYLDLAVVYHLLLHPKLVNACQRCQCEMRMDQYPEWNVANATTDIVRWLLDLLLISYLMKTLNILMKTKVNRQIASLAWTTFKSQNSLS